MKKIYLFLLVVFGYTAFGQQKGISYQAVIINPNGITAPGVNSTYVPLSNKAICLSFQIVNNNNQVEYQESQSVTTDVYGMVNMVIGTGTSGTGLVTKLDAINWNQGTKKLVVGVNTEGVCSNYTEISNQVLNYTPYSFYAQDADLKDGYVTDVKVAMGINPTKVGLGNVNNTSDANKPVSIATQTALNLKANLASPTFTGTVSGIDKAMIGLNNVDNTTDVNKPVSTATQIALNLKANAADVTTSLGLKEDLSNKSSDIATDASPTINYPTVKAVKDYVDANSNTGTIVDADTTTKGKIKLAGDLAGTADLPSVPGLAFKANATDVTTSLGLKEDISNKSNATLGTSTTLYPTQNAVKTYVDTAITGATIVDADTATKGKIKLAGDLAGTADLPTVPGLALKANTTDVTTSLALKEDASNKSNATLGTSTTLYPTQNAVKTYVDTAITGATIVDADTATKGKIKLAGDLAGTADLPTVPGLVLKANAADVNTALALKANSSSLSTVATSGDYNDLSNKPTIPSAYTLPTSSASVLGGVKVGTNLSIDGSGVLSANLNAGSITGTLSVANGGTGATTLTGIVKGTGTSAFSAAVAGTDFQAPLTLTTTGTGAATLTGNTLNIPTVSIGDLKFVTNLNNIGVGGTTTLANATGGDNVAMGRNALGSYYTGGISGGMNIGIGTDAGDYNSSGSRNIYVGAQAGITNQTGSDNTFIGYNTASSIIRSTRNSISNSTAIGANAVVTTSNKIQLGDTNITNVATSGSVTAGTVTYPNAHNSTAGQVLTVNAAGTASWETPASSSGTAHYVGEVYGGGIVFYITTGGFHGLIAETINSSGMSPADLLDLASDPNQHNTNNGGKLYTDWRVPTYSELKLLYAARNTVGLNLGTLTYQSSTLYYSFTYKALNFSNNTQDNVNGDWNPRITRYIRSF